MGNCYCNKFPTLVDALELAEENSKEITVFVKFFNCCEHLDQLKQVESAL